jgi:hypothetical protein
MRPDKEEAAEVISAARAVVAAWDSTAGVEDPKEMTQAMRRAVAVEREFTLIVAAWAASQLDDEAKALIRRLAGAAVLFRMNRGTPVTVAQFVAFIVGADGDSNVPYDEALKLEAEMTALGNQREAGDKWLN